MHGYPSKSYFPEGKDVEKRATFGMNRSVRVDTAVKGDMTPILLIHETQFGGVEAPPGIVLRFDGVTYAYDRYDQPTRRYIFAGPTPKPQSAETFPIGGDSPTPGCAGDPPGSVGGSDY